MTKGATDHIDYFAFNLGGVAKTRKIGYLSALFIFKLLGINRRVCLYDLLLI